MLHIIFSYSPLTDIVIERPYNLKDIERWSKEAVHSLPQDFLFEYNIEHHGNRIYSNGSWEITNERLSLGESLIQKLTMFYEEGKISEEQLAGILAILKEAKIGKGKFNEEKPVSNKKVEKNQKTDLKPNEKEVIVNTEVEEKEEPKLEEKQTNPVQTRNDPPVIPPREMVLDE
ncbi:hypothetical protein D4W36_12540, partial [Listeria monocytogenes]|nr:hypothetical protein [Listeria monocytogenes]